MSLTFYAWFRHVDAARVAMIEAALSERRTPLTPFSGSPRPIGDADPLVIFLSDRLLESAADRLGAVVEGWQGPVIPVELDRPARRPPEALERISWIETAGMTAASIAGRIALAGRTSPEWLLAWQDLRTAAGDDESDGPTLSSQTELDRAEATLRGRPRDLLPEPPPEVVRLLRDSRTALARRRRCRWALWSATLAILLVGGAVAFLQTDSENVARAHADRAATHSEADRLSRLAEQDLTADPDLPVLLARRAYRLDPEPETWEALRRALDAVPWHRSYRLASMPLHLAATPTSPFVVVVGEDGSASVFDSRDGRSTATAPRPRGAHGAPLAVASPRGGEVALIYKGGLVQVRALERGFAILWSHRVPGLDGARPRSAAWLRRGVATAWGSHGPIRLTLPSGSTRAIDLGISRPIAVAVSPNGKLLAAAGSGQIAIRPMSATHPCWTGADTVPGGTTLFFDARADYLLVARESGVPLQLRIPRTCGVAPARQEELRPLVWSESDVATALPRGGDAIGTDAGKVVLLEPPATYPAGDVVAHSAPVVGIGVTAGDSLVTVGSDRWLRVWRTPRLPTYPIGPAWNVTFNEAFGSSDARSTWRSMLASDPTGSSVTMGGLSSGTVAVLDPRHLGRARRSYSIAIDSSIRPASASPCAALELNGEATLYRCRGRELDPVWHHQISEDAETLFESAVSADGRMVAFAGLGSIALWEVSRGRSRRFRTGEVKALAFDAADELFAISANGSILEAPAQGVDRRIPMTLGDCGITAAGIAPSGDRAMVVCGDGEALLVDTANGMVSAHLHLGADLSGAIDVHFDPGGRLAAVVGRDGYLIVDLAKKRVIASGDEHDEREVGAQSRDLTFLGRRRTLLLLRADEGVERIDLARWRFLEGAALLRATELAIPRQLNSGEADPAALPKEVR
jgi:hypothetical protein